MEARDSFVAMAPLLEAFGVPATVTRPDPDDTPVDTTAIWDSHPLEEDRPVGMDLQRRQPRKVISLELTPQLGFAPNGTIILAPEHRGGEVLSWTVDGLATSFEPDLMRLIVVRTRTT